MPNPQNNRSRGASKMIQWRLAHRLSLREAAERAGVTHAAWNDWERGRRMPRPTHLGKLVDLVPDLDPQDFYVPCDAAAAVAA